MGVAKVVTKPVGCLLKILITIAIIVAIIAAIFFILINLTPRKLGLQDFQIGEQTVEEMGFADTSLKDIYKSLKALAAPNESEIVKNKPTEADQTAATENTAGSPMAAEEGGKPNYSLAIQGEVIYDKEYLLEYKDTTLAYIFSQLVKDANDVAETEENESIKFLAELGANFEEITISNKNAETGTATLRLVASISLESIKGQISNVIPEALQRFVPVPDKVYLVSYLTIDADENGIITCTSQNIKINDTDSVLTDAIFKVLAGSVEAEGDADTKATVNAKIGEGFSYFISNLGKVGTATVQSGTNEVDVKTLGDGGIYNGKLTLITNVAEE